MRVGFTQKESLVAGAIAICHKTGKAVSQMEPSCTRLSKLLVQDKADRPYSKRSGLSCTRFSPFLVQDKGVSDA
jgi:hypothetical protein